MNYDFIITDSSKKMQSAHVHVLDIDADSDKIWFLLHTNTEIYYTYIVPNTSVLVDQKTKKTRYFSCYFIGRIESR